MSEQALGSNVICQIALVVRDIARTAGAYAELFGMDVPEIRETAAEDVTGVRYRGRPTPGRARLAFFRMGSLSLELIEPVDGPSVWQEFLDEKGEGVHHIAFVVEGIGGEIAKLEARGMPVVQRGQYAGGRYAYVDTTAALKVMLELLEND
jgi:catechol 2,3-dioxygenase-like lactoylglutathione lyase family enzyme